jgi:hypothetical protein
LLRNLLYNCFTPDVHLIAPVLHLLNSCFAPALHRQLLEGAADVSRDAAALRTTLPGLGGAGGWLAVLKASHQRGQIVVK